MPFSSLFTLDMDDYSTLSVTGFPDSLIHHTQILHPTPQTEQYKALGSQGTCACPQAFITTQPP